METFDYIVVGAGSAGCAVTSALCRDPANKVLVIEAGPHANHFRVNTPAGMAKLFFDSMRNWNYQTEPMAGLGGRRMYWPRGIAPVHESPGVGQNLQDHFYVHTGWRVTPDSSYNANLRGLRKYWEGFKYLMTHKGFRALGTSQLAAFVKSRPDQPYADLQISFRPMSFLIHPNGKMEPEGFPGLGVSVSPLRPRTRGTGARVKIDDDIHRYLQESGNTMQHTGGTCKMGRDPMAVVDERLRVRGLERLRVVDASVMPHLTSGNTNAPSIMIGLKGGGMIVQDAVARRTLAA